MPALNFQKQFAIAVESKLKRQTIRVRRVNPIRQGQILYLYTGQRTKYVRKLGEAVCLSVERISIQEDRIEIGHIPERHTIKRLSVLNEIAIADGFKDWAEMRDWFSNTHNGLPFEGVLIKW